MINSISFRAALRIHGKIGRKVWTILWYFCRVIDKDGAGKVEILIPEIMAFFGVSRATVYRWLLEGKEAGAFWHYKTIDKHTMQIYLGSKTRVCKNLVIMDWDSTTEIELQNLFNNPEINLNGESLRKIITERQAYWMQQRSIEAAKEEEKLKVRKKRNRRKPFKPFKKKIRRAAGKPSLQLRAGQHIIFSRHHLPTGASQEGIGESLGVSDRTVRRHLEDIERVQMMYKVKPSEVKRGKNIFTHEKILFYEHPTGKKVPVIKREKDYYRYGCNLYDLDFVMCSEFTQRLKYKFSILLEEIPIEAVQWKKNKEYMFSELFSHLYMTKEEIKKKLSEKYELSPIDHVFIYIYWKLKTKSFGKFMIAVKEELKRLAREKYRLARQKEWAA